MSARFDCVNFKSIGTRRSEYPMCFGPVASFTASAVLFSIGTAILRNIKARKELLFAAFPFLFSVQQFIEGLLWIAIKTGRPNEFLNWLSFGFLLFAYGLWPLLCPLSVYVIEHDTNRKKHLQYLIALGALTGLYLVPLIIIKPVPRGGFQLQHSL